MALAKAGYKRVPREVLKANRTYYVRTDGNDANTGLVNNAGGAFLTIAKALAVAAALDASIYNVTVQVGAGTWTVPVVLPQCIGSGSFTLLGDATTPANVLLSMTGGTAVLANGINSVWTVQGFKLATTGAVTSGIWATNGAKVYYRDIDFGACTTSHVRADGNGQAIASGPTTISGNSFIHWQISGGGYVFDAGFTITLTGTPAFSNAFLQAAAGMAIVNNNTFVGSATGKRFTLTEGAIAGINGAGVNYLPGNVAGTWVSGSIYDGVVGGVLLGNLGATDNAILRADGTAGATAQGSSASISDTSTFSMSATAQFQPQIIVDSEWNGTHGGYVFFQKGRSGGPVQSGDDIGTFIGGARDTLSAVVNAAYFSFTVSAAPASGSVDANINFYTTQAATTANRMSVRTGLVVGTPTGGDKGQGTINASGVYDDNVLLTCMALASEFFENGTVNTDFWDSLLPPHVVPEFKRTEPYCEEVTITEIVMDKTDGGYISRQVTTTRKEQVIDLIPVWDENGNGISVVEEPATVEIIVPEQIIPRKHELAHLFKAMVEEGFDPRDPVQYINKLKTDEALPGMLTKKEWVQGNHSSGELLNRLWLATEMLALVVINLHERITALESSN